MIETPKYLKNYEEVIAIYGYWPAFHDANVRSFEVLSDTIRLVLHSFEMTSQVDASGYFVSHKHHLVSFEFSGITEADLSQFIPENILYELGFSSVSDFEVTGRFRVDLDSAMGGDLCGSFVATSAAVVSVLPCGPKGR